MLWEYKILKFGVGGFLGGAIDHEHLEMQLNEWGASGWELVAIFDTNSGQGASRSVFMTLKRPRS